MGSSTGFNCALENILLPLLQWIKKQLSIYGEHNVLSNQQVK